jgi:hypothetical protein
MKKDSFAILIDSASQDHNNSILIYDRAANQLRNILNPNPTPDFLGLRLLPTTGENPLLLVKDLQHVSVVDVASGTLVNLFSSPIDDGIIMSEFYLDVREEEGIIDIFTIEYTQGKCQVIKHTVPEAIIREVIEGYRQL